MFIYAYQATFYYILPSERNVCVFFLRLSGCYLRDDYSEILLAALQSEKSRLTLLDLSYSRMTDTGVTRVLTGLASPNSKLETLR